MSIAAMVDNEVRRERGQPPTSSVRRQALAAEPTTAAEEPATNGVVSALVEYVPAEAIAAYVLLLPFMDPSSADNGGSGGDTFTGRWWLALAVAGLACFYAIGYRKLAAIQAKRTFTFPWLPVFVTVLAFAAWVFALPNSPFNDFDFYTSELGAAVGTVLATGIAFVASLTGETLTYAKADSNDGPPAAGGPAATVDGQSDQATSGITTG